MKIATPYILDNDLKSVIEKGLSQPQKSLPSWLLYDQNGDKIFQEIMQLEEYYPTRCEFEILENHKEDLLRYFYTPPKPFKLIELGAGDATKTEVLLKHFCKRELKFSYVPIDISESVLNELKDRLTSKLPKLEVSPIQSEYFDGLEHLDSDDRKVILFLGANIGNLTPEEAKDFLSKLHQSISRKDLILIGFDLKKDPEVIEAAYDDTKGVTRRFNLNLLKRLNREFGANFDLDQFEHVPVYDPETGAAKSFLLSMTDQMVNIEALGRNFHFSQWESIFTEISQKYDLLSMERLLSIAGLEIVDLFFDSKHYFCDVLLKRNEHFKG
jgi:L-histidine Nalpha-methyltransferase